MGTKRRIPDVIFGALLTVAVFGIGLTFSHVPGPTATTHSGAG
jgi:hypothetical protein